MNTTRITIKQIAEKAEVSIGTVDRVLHNRGRVAAATREKIRRIAKEGKYTFNPFARSLKLNKTYRIGTILPDDNEYWQIQQRGMTQAFKEYEALGFVMSAHPYDRNNVESFLDSVRQVTDGQPDGIVIKPPIYKQTKHILEQFTTLNIPFVFVDSNMPDSGALTYIGQDAFQSGYLAASLLTFGSTPDHTCFLVTSNTADRVNKTVTERIEGFRDYYRKNDMSLSNITQLDLDSGKAMFQVLAQKLSGSVKDNILFVPNSLAFTIADFIIEQNLKSQIRILGYDLITENRRCLNNGSIDFLIHQKPFTQGYQSIQSLYKHLILKQEVEPLQYMPLDIITKENMMYYQ